MVWTLHNADIQNDRHKNASDSKIFRLRHS